MYFTDMFCYFLKHLDVTYQNRESILHCFFLTEGNCHCYLHNVTVNLREGNINKNMCFYIFKWFQDGKVITDNMAAWQLQELIRMWKWTEMARNGQKD